MFKKLQRTLDRKKQGKVPFKLRFIVHVQQISGLPAIFKQARVQWTRGAKVAMTNTVPVHDGVADFNEKLVQIATVYRDARNKIDPKEYSMKVQVPSKSDPSKMVSLGKVQMDIVSFIGFDGEVQAATLDVPFKLGEKGKLRFAVSSEVVQDGMDVDGMTEATGVTGLSSGFSEDLHQDLSGFEDAHTSSTHLHDHYQDRPGSRRSSGTGISSSATRPPVAPRAPKAAAAADMEAELKKAREEAELLRAQLELLQAGDEEPPQARPQGGPGGPSAGEWRELQEQCDDLEEELRQSRRSEANLQRQVAQLTAQLQAASSARDRTGGEPAVPSGASTLHHRSGSLEDAATLQRQLEEARLELAQLTADRARLQEQLGLVREEVEELKRQNDSLNDSLHHQSSRQEELRSELASASAQVASVGVREAEAEAMVQRLELQLREQSEEASRHQAEAEVARRELAAEAAEREVLQRSLMDASTASSAVQNSSALAVPQVVAAATAAKERRLAVLEEELEREREGMQKQLLEYRHTILQLESKLEQAARQQKALEDEALERQDLQQQRQGGQAASWGSQEELERVHAENEQMAEELVRVKLALAQRVDEELVLKRELHRTKEKAITYAQRATKWETAFYSKGRSQSGGWKWSVSGS